MPQQTDRKKKPDVKRDPEDRPVNNKHDVREKALDKTLADSFPTSDPPSTIPDPGEEDSASADKPN